MDLVVDDSPSMTVWADVVSGFTTLLRQLGAFQNIRTWRLSVGGAAPLLRNVGGQPVGADQLRAPGGRRMIIVVSDGTARGWYGPEPWQMIRSWAAIDPDRTDQPVGHQAVAPDWPGPARREDRTRRSRQPQRLVALAGAQRARPGYSRGMAPVARRRRSARTCWAGGQKC